LGNKKKMAEAKLKRLQSPDRIIKIAEEKLNMKLADEAPIILEVNEEKD
jgi:cell division protein FtsL